MDRLGFLEITEIVRSLGLVTDNSREFKQALSSFHEVVSDTKSFHQDVAGVVSDAGIDILNSSRRALVASIARRLKTKMRAMMHLKVVRETEDVYVFTVTFPDYKKHVDEQEYDLYHRQALLEVYDVMRTLSSEPPVIYAALWDGDLEDTIRSAAWPQNDDIGSLHFPGNGATYKTSVKAWRDHVPNYLDGVYKVKMWVDTGKYRVV